jgi:anti-sigma B factor antagonist
MLTNSFIVVLAGEIDIARADELDGLVGDYQRSDCRRVEVDLSRVSFCDSQGIALLVRLWQSARERDGDVTLVNASSQLRRTLKITGLLDCFRYDERVFFAEPA